ncbi:MAG: sigma-54-dependent transcriptional regulator [bacterium]
MADILVIDDENVQRKNIAEFLKSVGHNVSQSDGVARTKAILKEQEFDIVISDMRMKDGSGKDILDFMKEVKSKAFFILVTAYASVEDSIYVLKNGGYDYIQKPVNLDDLERKVTNISGMITANDELSLLKNEKKIEEREILFLSEKMKNVIDMAERVADTKAPVMIFGESGTGKELVARLLHEKSSRKNNIFVGVNCGALNENLLESELFGYEKGAFTGAQERRKGRFEIANKGTIFLDEVGDISLNMQVKLLRVLQEGEFERVGGNTPIKTDVRIITATHRNIEQMMKDKLFREDLYFRLNVVSLEIPKLSERKEDIMLLSEHFLKVYCAENQRKISGFSKRATEKLMEYDYPGNVRELQNIVQRAVILSKGIEIEDDDIVIKHMPAPVETGEGSLEDMVERMEKKRIAESLKKNLNSVRKTAEELKVTERVLRYKMEKYNLN